MDAVTGRRPGANPWTDVMRRSTMRLRAAAALFCGVAAPAVLAHHPMGEAVPQTAWHGLLSGLAHPVIGADHLLFVVAAAVAAACSAVAGATALRLLLAFVVAGVAGTLLRVPGIELPFVEAAVGASLLGVAALLWARWHGTAAAMALACVAGLLHGQAYGEAVVGAEATPVLAYLAGLALVQSMIAFGCFQAARRGRELAPEALGHAQRALAVVAAVSGGWMLALGAIA
jgi:urease accessory protein